MVEVNIANDELLAITLSRESCLEITLRDIETFDVTKYEKWLRYVKRIAVTDGIPQDHRKKLWLILSENYLKNRNIVWEKEEENCFNEQWRQENEELGIQIIKDLHRTGSSICTGPTGFINQAKLKKILLGYVRWNSEVGYCQGFNMLGAIILKAMDKDESDSLKVMIFLIEGILPAGYFSGSLSGLQTDMAVFCELMVLKLPRLARHLQILQGSVQERFSEPPLTNVFNMQWFLTMFCTCLPTDCVLRVWDLVFLEGSDMLLRTALAIWSLMEDKILKTKTADDFYCKVGALSAELLNGHLISTNGLIEKILKFSSIPDINKLREKHRAKGYTNELYCSDDDSDDDSKPTISNRRRSSSNIIFSNKEKLALDVAILKRQYDRLRDRQRKAHIILSAAVSRQTQNTASQNLLSVNHLLVGKSAIVTKKSRTGPLKGAIPPARKIENTVIQKCSDVKPIVDNLRKNNILLKQDALRKNSSIRDEPEYPYKKRSDSSSYSEESDGGNSSTSTSLCDDDDNDDDSYGFSKSNYLESKLKSSITVEKSNNIPKLLDKAYSSKSKDDENFGGGMIFNDSKTNPINVTTTDYTEKDYNPTTAFSSNDKSIITSISQLSPIADINKYISNSSISPIKTPISNLNFCYNKENFVKPNESYEQFDMTQGVTNKYFERLNIERPKYLDLSYNQTKSIIDKPINEIPLRIKSSHCRNNINSENEFNESIMILEQKRYSDIPIEEFEDSLSTDNRPTSCPESGTSNNFEFSAQSDTVLRIIEENSKILHRILNKSKTTAIPVETESYLGLNAEKLDFDDDFNKSQIENDDKPDREISLIVPDINKSQIVDFIEEKEFEESPKSHIEYNFPDSGNESCLFVSKPDDVSNIVNYSDSEERENKEFCQISKKLDVVINSGNEKLNNCSETKEDKDFFESTEVCQKKEIIQDNGNLQISHEFEKKKKVSVIIESDNNKTTFERMHNEEHFTFDNNTNGKNLETSDLKPWSTNLIKSDCCNQEKEHCNISKKENLNQDRDITKFDDITEKKSDTKQNNNNDTATESDLDHQHNDKNCKDENISTSSMLSYKIIDESFNHEIESYRFEENSSQKMIERESHTDKESEAIEFLDNPNKHAFKDTKHIDYLSEHSTVKKPIFEEYGISTNRTFSSDKNKDQDYDNFEVMNKSYRNSSKDNNFREYNKISEDNNQLSGNKSCETLIVVENCSSEEKNYIEEKSKPPDYSPVKITKELMKAEFTSIKAEELITATDKIADDFRKKTNICIPHYNENKLFDDIESHKSLPDKNIEQNLENTNVFGKFQFHETSKYALKQTKSDENILDSRNHNSYTFLRTNDSELYESSKDRKKLSNYNFDEVNVPIKAYAKRYSNTYSLFEKEDLKNSDENISSRLESIKNTIKSIDYLCQDNRHSTEKLNKNFNTQSFLQKTTELGRRGNFDYGSRSSIRGSSVRRQKDEEKEEYDNKIKRNNLLYVDKETKKPEEYDTKSNSSNWSKDNAYPTNYYQPDKLEIRHTTVTSTFYDRFLYQKSEKIKTDKLFSKEVPSLLYVDDERISKSACNSPTKSIGIENEKYFDHTKNFLNFPALKDNHIKSCDNILLTLSSINTK